MAATRCIKCTEPLTTGGQYCDDCRPSKEDAPFKATPSVVNVSIACPTCGRPYDAGTRFCAFCDHQTRTEVEYGGFWIRFGAKIIDNIILSAMQVPLVFLSAMGAASSAIRSARFVRARCTSAFTDRFVVSRTTAISS